MLIPSAVIGGSGPSLATCDLRRIPSHVRVYRSNNFFLEKEYYLGRKVDCLYFSCDPRAMRFYAATIRKVLRMQLYDIGEITTHQRGIYNFGRAAPNIVHFDPRPLTNLFITEARIKPTTGILAALKAVNDGAKVLYLSGIDFYAGDLKYAVKPGPRLQKVISPHAQAVGYDTTIHNHDIDLAILREIESHGVQVFCTSDQMPSPFPLGPIQNDSLDVQQTQKRGEVDDWVSWDGPIPLGSLLLLRNLRRKILSR